MPMTPPAALDAARQMMSGPRQAEASRLSRIHQALTPAPEEGAYRATFSIPEDAPPLMKELARKSETNYLPLLVKTFGQVLKVDGYLTKSDPTRREPWMHWQMNGWDAAQTGLHRAALSYGTAYATAMPGTVGRGEKGVRMTAYSPREMTAAYERDDDEWPLLALSVDRRYVTLYDSEAVYRFGIEDQRAAMSRLINPDESLSYAADAGWLTYIDTSHHDVGVTPVVRYRDRNLLAGEEQLGIVEPLIVINERIGEVTFQAMATSYVQLFKQRYIIGWVPATEEQELKAGAARMWYIDEDPANVRVDQLEAATIDMSLREASIRDFAAIGQIPAQALGVDGISNISDATLAGLEAAKNRESAEIATALGESHEQMLRLVAYIDGNSAAADDYDSEVRWRDFESRSFAQTVDGLVKLAQGLGIPAEILLEDVPGMTGQRLARTMDAMKKSAARDAVAQLAARRVGGASGPVSS